MSSLNLCQRAVYSANLSNSSRLGTRMNLSYKLVTCLVTCKSSQDPRAGIALDGSVLDADAPTGRSSYPVIPSSSGFALCQQ